jgi:hypothetical protein
MKITLSPQRRDDTLTVAKKGDALTINDVVYDFTQLPDGATLPAEAIDCEWIVGNIERIDGKLHLTILLPHGANASEAARFPQPIIDPANGGLELPQ